MYVGNIIHFNKQSQIGVVDAVIPWALLQEQEAGFPGSEETMLMSSNTMLKQPDEAQLMSIVLSSPLVPLNPLNVTSLTFTTLSYHFLKFKMQLS